MLFGLVALTMQSVFPLSFSGESSSVCKSLYVFTTSTAVQCVELGLWVILDSLKYIIV